VLGILHARLGLDPADYKFGTRGLHFHKEDPVTTHKSCPGRHMVKPDLVVAVVDYIEREHPGDHADIAPPVHTAPTAALAPNEMVSAAWLQAHLNSAGAKPPLAVDGAIGSATREAVTQFQLKHGLVPDGIAGPLTRLALKQATA
jgi:murein L,D-transpeptidase YcbB/YkuD